jgi:hypothetical protein
MIVLRNKSTHAVIGKGSAETWVDTDESKHESDGSVGIIEFHDSWLSAIAGAQRINREGGDVRVVDCDHGKLDTADQKEVDLLIHEMFKTLIARNNVAD